jgi:PAS domain S-box-containing protein
MKSADLRSGVDEIPTTLPDALAQLAVAQDTLRAIRGGEVDAFVVSHGKDQRSVFGLSTTDRPYRMFVESMRDGAATVSADGMVLFANNRLGELLACPTDAIIGRPIAEFVAAGGSQDWFQLAGAPGIGVTVEGELADQRGESVPVLIGSAPLDVDGERLVCLTFTDLTTQRVQEVEIERLTQAQIADGLRFTAMVEALHEGVLVQDDRGRVLSANRTASSILGVSVDDLLAEPPPPVLRNAVTVDGAPMPADQMPGRRALATAAPVLGVVVGLGGDDQRQWLEINSVPLRFPGDGEAPVVISSFRDVTARVVADEAIRFQALLLDTAGQAIIAVDDSGVVLYWNRFAEQMYGWSSEEAVGQPVVDLILPEDAVENGRELAEGLVEGDVSSAEHWVRRRDGTLFPVFATTTPAVDDHGRTVAYISVSKDITDRRQDERLAEETRQELAAARHAAELEAIERDEAIRANQAKSEFLSRMSHELRTPLNAVLGFGQILLLDDLNPEQREHIECICSAGNHLLDLINDVLDISRIEAGALMLSLEPVHLDEVVNQALSLIRPQAAQAGISLPLSLDDFGSVHVLSDRQRLLQVMLNLLSNAVKYNRRDGKVDLACQASGGTVSIAVTDTGMGIGEPDLAKLFTPFERLGAENTRIEGTGVGLALSRVLSQQMGGSLTVSSSVGTGSTFTLELPVSEPADAPAVSGASSHPTVSPGARPMTVLAIEDNVVNIRLLEHVMVRCENVTLLSAIQGRRGLEIAAQHHPDLILLDLNLPDLPGETVLQHLRADPATASIPVVICSADASLNQSRRLLESGAAAYLTKPVRLSQLFELIEGARAGNPPVIHPAEAEVVP